jgi:hypothetical protein
MKEHTTISHNMFIGKDGLVVYTKDKREKVFEKPINFLDKKEQIDPIVVIAALSLTVLLLTVTLIYK